MGPLIALLLPILIQVLPKLLESLVKKNDHATVAGYAGPMTAYMNATAEGKSDGEAFEAFCQGYVRCCSDARAAGQPV
jgi:hypothetical protein